MSYKRCPFRGIRKKAMGYENPLSLEMADVIELSLNLGHRLITPGKMKSRREIRAKNVTVLIDYRPTHNHFTGSIS